MSIELKPFSREELWQAYDKSGSINKHLLIIYSLAIGVYAQRALDLGVGDTTQTLRAAMAVTGGKLFSCDFDRSRFAHLVDQGDEHWEFFLGSSEDFLKSLDPPFDFAMHDAAHDYWQVRWDLEHMLPLMRRFGIVCVHDTQMSGVAAEMTRAVADAARGFAVSYLHLPFSCGLAILRVEESPHPAITPPWRNPRLPDAPGVAPLPCPMEPAVAGQARSPDARAWVLWMLQRVKRRFQEIIR